MWTCQTTEHFPTLHQSILDELGPREAGGVSGCCWYMAFILHSRVLTCTYRCCDELYLLTMVWWSVPEPMWRYPLHIDVGFWCRAARGIKGHGHSVLIFGLAAYVQRFLQILWTFWWYYGPYMMKSLNFLRFTLRNIVLKLFDEVFSRSCSKSGVPRPILACEWLSLSGMLFLYLIIAPNYSQLTCSFVGCSIQLFDEHSSTFSVFSAPFPNFFVTCCCHQILKLMIICKKQLSLSVWTINILSL